MSTSPSSSLPSAPPAPSSQEVLDELLSMEDLGEKVLRSLRESIALQRISVALTSEDEHPRTAMSASFSNAASEPESADMLLCTLCMDKPLDTVFNCGHQCCGDCCVGLSLVLCPFCRETITTKIRVL